MKSCSKIGYVLSVCDKAGVKESCFLSISVVLTSGKSSKHIVKKQVKTSIIKDKKK
ncbi:hypothetical protein SAMN02982990_00444 [Photorhabdus luminescens]|uniref:Uncharacterized protein n=1 Tax=Photorhabdus luminescens TaxID=29488 RepID=A0A1G5PWA0_PHOLU|nr:hypothetical protein SAMN02982990_00444 [Photorhabdus luminescens]